MGDVYELLTRELGRERVLRAPEALEVYAQDESRLGVFPPDAAVGILLIVLLRLLGARGGQAGLDRRGPLQRPRSGRGELRPGGDGPGSPGP